MAKVERAIYKIFFDCFKLTAKDSCLIVVDETTRAMGQLLFNRLKKSRCQAALLEIKTRSSRLGEPSAAIFNIMKQMSAVLAFTGTPMIHTKALKQLCHFGARVLCLYPVTVEGLARAVNTDYEFIDKKSRKLSDLFSIGRCIHLTTEAGTDLTIPISRHKGEANTGIVNSAGMLCSLPSGEANITPNRRETQGVVVVDGSIPGIGVLKQPAVIHIRDGYAYQISGGPELEKLRKILKSFGKTARNVAEFGIGTNPNATLTGDSIEDEKVLGSAHIALGSPDYEGGIMKKYLHIDLVFMKPTVSIDNRIIVENGKILV
ncbi:MAG: aminopeptidase [candidate division KSB1 bacterium]|nr:aminopeptidase [candidate division KSB1 bacterium]MDZ7335564.1 aminopeptidase [candidate division KSB1 bacterium]MDZ7356436.1 aminopeptidase [candidate division KSB1 bacterium]MDZ7401207.1 aminopeptidase [candidate division KSB1 bacterium]